MPRQPTRGFSLIELMIAVAVVSILAAVALPTFNDAIRKGRRSEAFAALSQVQQAQERWRSNNATYASNTQLTLPVTPATAGDPVGLGLSATTGSGRYGISIANHTGTGYEVLATAVSTGSQANDGACAKLRIRASGGNLFYGSTTASGTTYDEGTGNRCWSK
jgi:type IV pilus assembly protein PilE